MSLLIAAMLAAVQEPAPPAPADRIVCKYEARTGTRFKKHICHTRGEWERMAAAAQRDAHEMADRPRIPLDNPSGQPSPR